MLSSFRVPESSTVFIRKAHSAAMQGFQPVTEATRSPDRRGTEPALQQGRPLGTAKFRASRPTWISPISSGWAAWRAGCSARLRSWSNRVVSLAAQPHPRLVRFNGKPDLARPCALRRPSTVVPPPSVRGNGAPGSAADAQRGQLSSVSRVERGGGVSCRRSGVIPEHHGKEDVDGQEHGAFQPVAFAVLQ